ncbi:hypothetical protein LX77_01648 [Gelidibacter algens]|jgi:hypothetical protein|uniref:Uncharacterized protein n=1 Tax=Gelidibacter algens TaxID=49280 RepID=A0A1A7QWW0_9FLAO|nr:hypothetical protein A9996_14915 [Gelidibacter algens]RAJ25345.1 hypothetical protein LX77_01648 [Gelidibacter algens]
MKCKIERLNALKINILMWTTRNLSFLNDVITLFNFLKHSASTDGLEFYNIGNQCFYMFFGSFETIGLMS